MSQTLTSSEESISAHALQQYVKSAEFCGLKLERLLGVMGISNNQLQDNNYRFPARVLIRLLDYVLPNCGDPLYGLHSAPFVQPGTWGIFGYISMTSNSLGEAIARVPLYEKLVADVHTMTLEYEPGFAIVRWDCSVPDPAMRRHIIESTLASSVIFARWIAEDGDSLNPVAMRFEHDPPQDPRLLQHYQDVFRCPVFFNQNMSAAVLPLEVMDHPLRQPDPVLREALEQMAQTRLGDLKVSFSTVDQVRSVLRTLLPDLPPRKEIVAQKMGIHVRTLHRKLVDENTTFQHVLDEFRLDLAARYLREGCYTMEQISRRLGFTESRSFNRYFKAHFGLTPSEFRRQAGTTVEGDAAPLAGTTTPSPPSSSQ